MRKVAAIGTGQPAGRVTAADPDPPVFVEGLNRLLAAVEDEARLTPAGWRAIRRSLAATLVTQLRVRSLVRSLPAIRSVGIDRPVFLTGAHRSGTTLLQRLLAQHPQLRAPALWEQLAPADLADRASLIRRAQQYVDDYYRVAPDLPAIHFLAPGQPDECHRLLGTTFRSEIFELRYRVPSYGRWLAAQDATVVYRYHRTLLRCMSWRTPAARLVLKCPFHLSHLDAIGSVYPDAVVIRLHRDPAQTVPSACSLIATIRRAWSDQVDPVEIGRCWLSRTTALLAGLVAGRDRCSPLPVLDLTFPELVRDPLAVAARACAFAGVPMTREARARMATYLDDNPPGRHGRHRYRPADFGLERRDLDHRFAPYRARFDL